MNSIRKCIVSVIAISVIAFAVQSPVFAAPTKEALNEKWEYYATDEDDIQYSYDAGNVERMKNKNVKVWVQATYPEKHPTYAGGRFQWEMDCTNRKMRGVQAYVLKKDGTTKTIAEKSDWSVIPAGSTAETLLEKACQGKGKKKP